MPTLRIVGPSGTAYRVTATLPNPDGGLLRLVEANGTRWKQDPAGTKPLSLVDTAGAVLMTLPMSLDGAPHYTTYTVIWPARYNPIATGINNVGGAANFDVLADLPAVGGDLTTAPATDATYCEIATQGKSVNFNCASASQVIWASGPGLTPVVVGSLPAGATMNVGSAIFYMRLDSPVSGSVYPSAISLAGLTGTPSGDYPVTAGDNVYTYDILDAVMTPGNSQAVAIGEKLGFKLRWARMVATYTAP